MITHLSTHISIVQSEQIWDLENVAPLELKSIGNLAIRSIESDHFKMTKAILEKWVIKFQQIDKNNFDNWWQEKMKNWIAFSIW